MAETIVLYMVRDNDPHGGYFSAQEWKPDTRILRPSDEEMRVVVSFPLDVWQSIVRGDDEIERDPDGSMDSFWVPWWAQGTTIWTRT